MEPDDSAISSNKLRTRQVIHLGLRGLTSAESRDGAARIRRFFATAPGFTKSRVILLFAALPTEPDLLDLIASHGDTHRFALPRVRETHGDLHLLEVRHIENDLRPGAFGIREPDPDRCPEVSIGEIDLAAIPGLAFTTDGSRLGRGGGFYDRLLSHPEWRAESVGVAFSRQIVDTLPLEAHDQKVRRVLTPEGWLSG